MRNYRVITAHKCTQRTSTGMFGAKTPKRKAMGSNPVGDVKQKATLHGWLFVLHGMEDSNAP